MADSARIWAVVPAAGIGRRFGGGIPKQYHPLPDGRSVLDASIDAVLADARIEGVMVALAATDTFWSRQHSARRPSVRCCTGGAERCDSVLNALRALRGQGADEDDWVLVHDAARPGLPAAALTALIDHCLATERGGILALPLRDTLKACDGQGHVQSTLPREGLWQAQTPQMFPLGRLESALAAAIDAAAAGRNPMPGDEASAMEWAGQGVDVVAGSWRNVKLTFDEDRQLVEALFRP
ncbi:2-C-methyl-D-erythritol 4-phosphate cytidylyltransferase [Natronospira bacteriovora]|uniref:2-C-methyl-D-erythritol 4-phosphate cytidylyltransferase n=1 Tax=Natronospira bacteriovora TaxID=3069753 RepID=A0ABU0W3F8_9GAMM|nr:2-C-methyl-D-erythritol 4-phosphate cytidylyltransferase [Natronospira sp. AB-CW4]MDQ2068323.1 2-C-methyl-D-erythritol 4-phosphate cytidylyltransferase [Natronospira sp. AB-CW4]